MTTLQWLSIFLFSFAMLSYNRASLRVWTLSLVILLIFLTRFSALTAFRLTEIWAISALIFIPLNVRPWRQRLISLPILHFYRKVMPTMSKTEREALAAGTVSWEGDLFSGAPQWDKLLALPKPSLSKEEQAFMDGPVQTLCDMIDDWDITHVRADLPPALWQYIREQGFFGLIIPKSFGGKEFSAYAHSQIIMKIYGVSNTVASTVSVPNSLGPAELLLHYGTEEQKNYYLPRLASGEEIPCFALTGPSAGSDAGAIPDRGTVCWREYEGKKTLGINLKIDKRYITLAPVATVIGLAFKLYDPEHLLGKKENIGITCALIPRSTPGLEIGRRHFPLNVPFQNGPIRGDNIFIPIEWIIGGAEMAGHGWQMLMECLAAGRAISLPASSVGNSKSMAFSCGGYARIRRQFNTPIGKFEGIEEPLARIVGNTYIIDSARTLAAVCIDQGAKPAIASAIVKYHTTELGRRVVNDAMDIHGGKGICLGPKNYLARSYQSAPIPITVEGANILSRCLIIFGQGAIRCHPFLFDELEAAKLSDPKLSLQKFDKALFGHFAYTISNFVRTLVLGLTCGVFVRAPKGNTQRYFQYATRFSAAFALVSDICLITLGGALKRKESLSGRLGDILSYLYLLSAVLKQYHDQESLAEDKPIITWTIKTLLHQIQQKFAELCQNFPVKGLGAILSWMIFPFGKHFNKPSDHLSQKLAQMVLAPTGSRARLTEGAFISTTANKGLALIEDALLKTIATEPIEKAIRSARRDDLVQGDTFMEQANSALEKNIISVEQCELVLEADAARKLVIAVDDFAPEELGRG